MQITTITCDRCKKPATTKEEKETQDILRVSVGVFSKNHYGSQSTFEVRDALHTVEWCKTCRDEMGLFYHRKENPTHASTPTIEDIIREIATEAAQEAVRQ